MSRLVLRANKTPRWPRLADKALVRVMQVTEVFEP